MADRIFDVRFATGPSDTLHTPHLHDEYRTRQAAIDGAFKAAKLPGVRFVTVRGPSEEYIGTVPFCHERLNEHTMCGAHRDLVNGRCREHRPEVGQLALPLGEVRRG